MILEELEQKFLEEFRAGQEVRDAVQMVTRGLQTLRKHRRNSRPTSAKRQVIDTFRVGVIVSELEDMNLTVRVSAKYGEEAE